MNTFPLAKARLNAASGGSLHILKLLNSPDGPCRKVRVPFHGIRRCASTDSRYPVWLQVHTKSNKHDKTTITPVQLETWRESMSRLEKLGCRSYQLVEAPFVLDFPEEKVYERLDTLQQNVFQQVSIPLIGLAVASNGYNLRKKISTYLTKTQGFNSIADLWRNFFSCTESEMDIVIANNPQLLSRTGHIEQRLAKAQLLLDTGVSKTRLRESSRVLVVTPFNTLKRRLGEIEALGLQAELSLRMLAQADLHYQKALKRNLERKECERNRWDILAKLLNTDKEVLENYDVLRTTRLDKLESRIRYLIDLRGYKAEDLLDCPGILHKIEVDRLKKGFRQMEEAGLEEIDLSTLHSFLTYNKLPLSRSCTQRSLQKTLGTDVHEMAEVIPREYTGLFQQRGSVIRENYTFLNEVCGFERSVILDLPVILGHAHSVLREHWKRLPYEHSVHFDKWRGDPRKLINLLQYDIERSVNFKHRVLSTENPPE